MPEPGFVLKDKMKYADYRKMAVAYCEKRGIPVPKSRPSRPL